jgi:hypothetical protein
MTHLAPDLFQRRFQDLVEIGRAQLPSLAPEWTDQNAHDPGITLMELLAWVGEAQFYSLSRQRRDERAAYAGLLGILPAGARAATGLIWSDPLDPGSPAATFMRSQVISPDTVINVVEHETPTFRPARKLLWVPGQISLLESRLADSIVDLTATNKQGGVAFVPFGNSAGARDVLRMTFVCRGQYGLFPEVRSDASGALWPIGIRSAVVASGTDTHNKQSLPCCPRRLDATLIVGKERTPLEIAYDSTDGLLTTGVLLLSLDNVIGSPQTLTIELRNPNGFSRPPRLLRIEPNVIPIVQGQHISQELQFPTGMPDWSFTLNLPGLRFDEGKEPVKIESWEASGLVSWKRHGSITDCGPQDRAYELDATKDKDGVRFGNGVNGRIPELGSQILVDYAVCDGEEGNVACNRKWRVAGFAGAFGTNPDPVAGGAAASDTVEQRREARQRARDDHALVSSQDITAAATSLALLEVARAWVVPTSDKLPGIGTTTLVVMRKRATAAEPAQPPETRRWLEAVRRSLAPRMPLGTRLVVKAPAYVEFSITATVEANDGLDLKKVNANILKALKQKLALVDPGDGTVPRRPGIPVAKRDVAAWIRGAEGVARIVDLRLVTGTDSDAPEILVPRNGLPKWNSVQAGASITVVRPGGAA